MEFSIIFWYLENKTRYFKDTGSGSSKSHAFNEDLLKVSLGLCDSRRRGRKQGNPHWLKFMNLRVWLFLLPALLNPMANRHRSIFKCCSKEVYCKINTKLGDSTGKTEIMFLKFLSILKEVVVQCFASVWGARVIYLNSRYAPSLVPHFTFCLFLFLSHTLQMCKSRWLLALWELTQ